jgi:hypothetical protein
MVHLTPVHLGVELLLMVVQVVVVLFGEQLRLEVLELQVKEIMVVLLLAHKVAQVGVVQVLLEHPIQVLELLLVV